MNDDDIIRYQYPYIVRWCSKCNCEYGQLKKLDEIKRARGLPINRQCCYFRFTKRTIAKATGKSVSEINDIPHREDNYFNEISWDGPRNIEEAIIRWNKE